MSDRVTYGFAGKWLRVDLTNETLKEETFPEEMLRKYIGSSALAAKILMDETDGDTDPLGPDNVLIFAAGILNNTKALCCGRYQVVAKSPATDGYGEGNSGGSFAPMIKRAGYDGIIFNGKAKKPVYLALIEGEVKLESAEEYWGMDSFEVSDALRERYNKKAVVACIGQAGENLVKIAAVMNDGEEGRCAGRCGMGAVMGSKNLKAIVAYGTKKTPMFDEQGFAENVKEVSRGCAQTIKNGGSRAHGTNGGWVAYTKIGEEPVKNWKLGYMEGIEKLGVDVMEEKLNIKPYFCAQCIVGCGRSAQVTEGKYKSIRTGGPEYETVGLLGSNLMITDIEAVQMGNEMCNRYGIDTISGGSVIGWGMEAYELGLITKEDTNGLELKWGDADVMLELLRRIAYREDIGDLLAEGVKKASEKLGKGSDQFAVHVRGLEPPAHDPRSHVSNGIMYVTCPRGASHECSAHSNEAKPNKYSTVKFNDTLTPGVSKNMGTWFAEMQNPATVIDPIGACRIASNQIGSDCLKIYTDWINLMTGWDLTTEELSLMGERLHTLKWLYNYRCGMRREDMKLPERLSLNYRGEGGNAETLPHIELMLAEYFTQKGWSEFGIPLPETIKRLGLEEEFEQYNQDVLVGPAMNGEKKKWA